MTQPEALYLAEILERGHAPVWSERCAIAAELRRLHAQRDALLEALKAMIDDLDYYEHARVINAACAAIAAVEGGEKT